MKMFHVKHFGKRATCGIVSRETFWVVLTFSTLLFHVKHFGVLGKIRLDGETFGENEHKKAATRNDCAVAFEINRSNDFVWTDSRYCKWTASIFDCELDEGTKTRNKV